MLRQDRGACEMSAESRSGVLGRGMLAEMTCLTGVIHDVPVAAPDVPVAAPRGLTATGRATLAGLQMNRPVFTPRGYSRATTTHLICLAGGISNVPVFGLRFRPSGVPATTWLMISSSRLLDHALRSPS